ncbi:transmembrane protein, putative (macronuclear) [Tetrahymena thermophila SB210]|uniref:Transmembrane protein, putative n=1 Tax=Tetrahymena thermophila (strain SB210) TaxID=312017 RepID=Q23BK9_TETTS|nr:transmembrane protein, putative [Tetrahymena thermophila SB210]EAR94109.2 transmembrane protein, putative [Tetrahymena thermophila SB210]|eukprot:XP_001014354.2 transmembrane protein, putative [Tetrahymena thermophila SB210]
MISNQSDIFLLIIQIYDYLYYLLFTLISQILELITNMLTISYLSQKINIIILNLLFLNFKFRLNIAENFIIKIKNKLEFKKKNKMRKIASILILISIAIFTANASKCEDDLITQLRLEKVCQNTDAACNSALVKLLESLSNCYTKHNTESVARNCFVTSCSYISNHNVKDFYNKMLACADTLVPI